MAVAVSFGLIARRADQASFCRSQARIVETVRRRRVRLVERPRLGDGADGNLAARRGRRSRRSRGLSGPCRALAARVLQKPKVTRCSEPRSAAISARCFKCARECWLQAAGAARRCCSAPALAVRHTFFLVLLRKAARSSSIMSQQTAAWRKLPAAVVSRASLDADELG